ncbi:MYND finger, partial [Opisthorchis viverrini]
MDYVNLRNYRHADPLKVKQVWDTIGSVKGQRLVIPTEKLVKSLRKQFGLKDDQIRLLLDEIEGDSLIEKVGSSFGKGGPAGYRLPDFSRPCSRSKHDWYCFQCHRPGEVLKCSDCFRVYHVDCANEASKLSSPSGKSLRSPTLHDGLFDDFSCAVCESRPKCEFSRKQIRKLLEFATHHLRKQPLWKTFLHIGYPNEINKNEYLVYKYTDLELLQRKIKDGRYAALEEFSMDVQLLVHNVCILHGPFSSEADEVRFFLRSVNAELIEIQLCTDCYINAKTRLTDWISKPCKPPHELIWACNRTSAGAGIFNDSINISSYFWPAKVLLERDDAYEVRFFGGTHERAVVKKSNTRPFHLPADEIGVLRRTGTYAGCGFERAWNEVTKLQGNIESGYYTHSSGESDLPPSEDEYSDEVYLAPRRGTMNTFSKGARTESPRSSSTSNQFKRRRHTSSSSHQTTTSATPTIDEPPPVRQTSSSRVSKAFNKSSKTRPLETTVLSSPNYNDKKRYPSKLPMPVAQPGTPGAAAISALAETKAAMAAAVGSSHKSSATLTADLLSLTNKHDSSVGLKSPLSPNSRRPSKGVRGRRGPGRPPKRDSILRRPVRRKTSSSPSSSHSSRSISPVSSNSDSELANGTDNRVSSSLSDDSENNWHPKKNFSTKWETPKKTRGGIKSRGPKARTSEVSRVATENSDVSRWHELAGLKPKPLRYFLPLFIVHQSPGRGRPRSRHLKHYASVDGTGRKRLAAQNKESVFGSSVKKSKRTSDSIDKFGDRHDEDDELTDRCCSPALSVGSPGMSARHHKGHRRQTTPIHSPDVPPFTHSSPGRKGANVSCGSLSTKHSPTKRPNDVTPKRRSSPSSNFSSCSSPSTSEADSDSGFANRRRTLTGKVAEDDRKFRCPTRSGSNNKEGRLSGTSSTMLRRPPFAPPLSNSSTDTGRGGSAVLNSDRASLSAATNLFPSHHATGNLDHTSSHSTSHSATLSVTTQLAGSVSSGNIVSNNSVSTTGLNSLQGQSAGMSSLPRSHLPPNKRAAAAANAAAMNRTGNGLPNETGVHPNQSISPRGMDGVPAASSKKCNSRGVQTTPQTCLECKDRETQRLAEQSEHKRTLQELEDRLTLQFREEKAAAVQAAVEQAQTSLRESMEREKKLDLEAAEARFSEIIVQTKRRQWCRNCLCEAIYHCCWNTSYCSIPCQQEHWQNEHKRHLVLTDANSPIRSVVLQLPEIEGTGLEEMTKPSEPTSTTQQHQTKSKRPPLLEDSFDVAPSGLRFCFDRECFLNDEFHSDAFILTEERRGASLENLRDSLLQYSNILKSSLVELINQDYADFVNLSSNLVGLDKAIDNIAMPLQEFQASVLAVIAELDAVEQELTVKLQERQKLRDKKDLLNSLNTMGECVTRLERWLTAQATDSFANEKRTCPNHGKQGDALDAELSEDNSFDWPTEFTADFSLQEDPGQRIERVATEYIKLQFFARKCHDHPIVQCMKPRIQWITSVLQEQLESRLKAALDVAQLTSSSSEQVVVSKHAGALLRQALSTYLMIDKLSDFVQLYRQYSVRPKLSKIFTPRPELLTRGSDTNKAVATLDGMYTEALKVLSHQLDILHQLSFHRSSESYDPLAEFDCLVDGFWPETVDLLCTHLSDMFDPGDPDRFFELYVVSQKFISKLEAKILSTKQLDYFRNSPAYNQFASKWSLPVYFQIRFQEIAAKVETVMRDELALAKNSSQGCLLEVTDALLTQVQRCWKQGVYLHSLKHRFFRLTLQLLSRYATFVVNRSNEKGIPDAQSSCLDSVEQSIYLLVDVHRVATYATSELPTLIRPALGHIRNESTTDNDLPLWLTDCLAETAEQLFAAAKPLGDGVLAQTEQSSLSVSRMILDIPRQYRRTNRTLPNAASAYLAEMIAPLRRVSDLSATVSCAGVNDTLAELVRQCIAKVSGAYLGQLTEVLNAVKKMEDSLRKLREVRRGGGSTFVNQSGPPGNGTYSDDDKIRHQLYLDACAFRDQVGSLWGANAESMERLQKIVELTQYAKTEGSTNT